AQLQCQPRRGKTDQQAAEFFAHRCQVQLLIFRPVGNAETATDVEYLRDEVKEVSGTDGQLGCAAEMMDNTGGVKHLRASEDVKADDAQAVAGDRLAAARQVVEQQAKAQARAGGTRGKRAEVRPQTQQKPVRQPLRRDELQLAGRV